VMLKAPKGIWGYVADRFGWQLFPLSRRLVRPPAKDGADLPVRVSAPKA
jgi:hypothetical protein